VSDPIGDLPRLAAIAGAGLAAGAVNALAGGGSLLSFPALIAAGLPPLLANVTNTVALAPGYLGGDQGNSSASSCAARPGGWRCCCPAPRWAA
jgi:hypothetical protein